MSGGSFNYAFHQVGQFIEELEVKLDNADKIDEFGCCPNYFEPRVLAKLRNIATMARYTAKLMKEVEWLYSGDIGEDTFMKRIDEICNEFVDCV